MGNPQNIPVSLLVALLLQNGSVYSILETIRSHKWFQLYRHFGASNPLLLPILRSAQPLSAQCGRYYISSV